VDSILKAGTWIVVFCGDFWRVADLLWSGLAVAVMLLVVLIET